MSGRSRRLRGVAPWVVLGLILALGLWLRQVFYPLLLKRCGRNVAFGTNVVLRHPHKIEIDDNVIIDDNCLLDAKGRTNAGIHIGAGTYIGRNSILSCKNGDIVLGRNVNIGFNCDVFSGSRVENFPLVRSSVSMNRPSRKTRA